MKGKQKPMGFEASVSDQDWTSNMQFYLNLQQMGGKSKILTKEEKKKEEREQNQ